MFNKDNLFFREGIVFLRYLEYNEFVSKLNELHLWCIKAIQFMDQIQFMTT